MKTYAIATITLLLLASCNTKNKQTTENKVETTATVVRNYPEAMTTLFDAHGGIATWNKMNNLCFTIPKDIAEIHTIDLKSRKARIETTEYVLGFNGDKVWLKQDTVAFKPERARFYHNLMFYFYAMPFVLGDDGITYETVAPLEKDGVSYPGTKISFGENVGDAPDDNYIVYQDPKTNEMAWLAYTVTYNSKAPSERYSYIKYAGWQDVNGLKLPSTLQWYTVADGVPTEMRNEMTFAKPTITETILNASIFEKPTDATFAE